MLLAVVTGGDDAECRAVVYQGRGAITFTRGTWRRVRGDLVAIGLALGASATSVADSDDPITVIQGREGLVLCDEPSDGTSIETG